MSTTNRTRRYGPMRRWWDSGGPVQRGVTAIRLMSMDMEMLSRMVFTVALERRFR